MPTPMYMLETDVLGCRAEVSLNDVPAAVVEAPRASHDARTVNQLVVPGKNVLSAVLCTGPTPSQVREPALPGTPVPAEAGLTVRLKRYPQGALPGDPGIVQLGELTFSPPWPLDQTPPLAQSISIDLPTSLSNWLRRRLPPMTLDESTRAAVFRLLNELADSLSGRNPNPFFAASTPRLSDVSNAFGMNADALRESFIEDLQDVSAEPGWAILRPDPDLADLRLVGEGRLIDCIGIDWLPLLRSVPNASGLIVKRYPLRLAMMGDSLKVIR